MSIGVVIGDSIACGLHVLWGRLYKDFTIQYDADYPDITGQFSTEFTKLFGFRWYNHGIGGQKTADIWARWRRDVLGETYDPGDGAGNKTLSNKADYVYVHVGTNDVRYNVSVATTKSNLELMAQSCQSNGIIGIFSNIPLCSDYDATKHVNALDINSWMAANLPIYGVIVEDEYTFTIDLNNPTKGRFEYYPDGIHPNKDGYIIRSRMVYETYLNSL